MILRNYRNLILLIGLMNPILARGHSVMPLVLLDCHKTINGFPLGWGLSDEFIKEVSGRPAAPEDFSYKLTRFASEIEQFENLPISFWSEFGKNIYHAQESLFRLSLSASQSIDSLADPLPKKVSDFLTKYGINEQNLLFEHLAYFIRNNISPSRLKLNFSQTIKTQEFILLYSGEIPTHRRVYSLSKPIIENHKELAEILVDEVMSRANQTPPLAREILIEDYMKTWGDTLGEANFKVRPVLTLKNGPKTDQVIIKNVLFKFHKFLSDKTITHQEELEWHIAEFLNQSILNPTENERQFLFEFLAFQVGGISPRLPEGFIRTEVKKIIRQRIKNYKYQLESYLQTNMEKKILLPKSEVPTTVFVAESKRVNPPKPNQRATEVSSLNANKRKNQIYLNGSDNRLVTQRDQNAESNPNLKPKKTQDRDFHDSEMIKKYKALPLDEIISARNRELIKASQYYYFKFDRLKVGYEDVQLVQINPKIVKQFKDIKSGVDPSKWLGVLKQGFATRAHGANGIKALIRNGEVVTWWEIKIMKNPNRLIMKKDANNHWYIFDIASDEKMD